uniref:C2H2-type domain-containing protein n=1 Tax=Timema shepardi TaxID=629360 RepID=A0A7R9ASX7_TIMSH|nr:unnamed protein product [Timema shepardi]
MLHILESVHTPTSEVDQRLEDSTRLVENQLTQLVLDGNSWVDTGQDVVTSSAWSDTREDNSTTTVTTQSFVNQPGSKVLDEDPDTIYYSEIINYLTAMTHRNGTSRRNKLAVKRRARNYCVDVQVLGPFPRTINQSEYIVSIVDPITKWIVARPVSEDNIGSHIACFIFKTFCDFGFTKCSVSSLPPHLYTDIVNTFVECCRNMQKQFTLPGQSQTPGKIANLVSITEVVTDCEWCRHCEELFTSKISFRIHQRKHTEEARGRGVLEGEEPIGLTDATSRVTAHKRLTSLKSVRQRIKSRLDHVLERLKSKQNTTIKSSSKNGVDASLQAIAIAAVKRLLAETKYQRKSRGKYYKFSQEIHEEMAHHAMEHGILQSSRLFSERLGVKVSCSTIRNIVKSYRSYTPELKEEIGRYAAGFGVDAASRHFSARLNREVRQGLVRKFKNYYLSRYPDPTNKFDSKKKKGTNKKKLLDAKQKDDIGAHAVTAGVAATVKYFKEKQNICLREAVVRKLRKIYLDKNPVQVQDSILQCQLQREPMSNVQHSTDPSQALNIFQAPMTFLNSVQMGSRPSTMVFDQTFNPQIDPSNQLITLPHQNSSLSISSAAINNINNSTNTTSNFLPIHHQQVTSTTTSVIINQDNSFDQSTVQLPLYQHSQQLYSSFNIQGNTLENNLIPLNNNVANVTPVTLTINQQPLNHQPLSNQVSSQAAGSGVVLQTLNTMAPLTLEKRGRYTMYTPKTRAEMGRYAAVFGSAQACEHFKKILGHDVAESTIRGLRDKYLLMCGDLSNGSSKVKEVTSLDYNQRGRPMRLGKYDQVVQDCIHELSKTGEKLSSFLVITTAKQVLMQYEPELLEENGGNIKLTSTWAKSFLKRIGVQNHS